MVGAAGELVSVNEVLLVAEPVGDVTAMGPVVAAVGTAVYDAVIWPVDPVGP